MTGQEARDDEREALIAEAMRRTTDLDVTTNPPVTRAFIRRLGVALESAHRELVEARKHPEPEAAGATKPDPWSAPFSPEYCNCADGNESPAFPEARREHDVACRAWDDVRAEEESTALVVTEEMVEDLRQRLFGDIREVINSAFDDAQWVPVGEGEQG